MKVYLLLLSDQDLHLHLMGDGFKLTMAYLFAGEKEYERKPIWSQSKENSRMPDQHTFFYTLCLKMTLNELSKFLVAHSKLSAMRCIQSQSKGHGFENFSGYSAKVCNSGVSFHELR